MILNVKLIFDGGVWEFGSAELIQLISAFATFCAIVVSLFLALKAKTVKYKIFVNHEMAGLRIVNTGDAKVFVNAFGVYTNDIYYVDPYERFCKVLTHPKQIFERSTTFQEHSLGYVVLEPGDVVEVGLGHFDYSLLNNRSKLFISIAGKIKKYKLNRQKICCEIETKMDRYLKYSLDDIKNNGFYLRKK